MTPLLVLGLAWALITSACGNGDNGSAFNADGGSDSASSEVDSTVVGDDGPSLVGEAGPVVGALAIAPTNQVIDVQYGQRTPIVTYTATWNGQAAAASFAIDRAELGGVVAATGVMTPTGLAGGVATVTATYNGQKASTHLTVLLHLVDNGVKGGADAGAAGAGGNGGVGGEGAGGPVSVATQGVLQSQPSADSGLSWLYPYDQTVWPRGLLAPLLQWTALRTYDAVYIHLKENAFDYSGFFARTAAPFVHHPIPQTAWDALSLSNQGETVSVSLVFTTGGQAYGPLTETWKIAKGTLKGTVYYNSYGTNLAHNHCCTINNQPFGGATLGIKHGATAPVLVAGNDQECRVCHSVSADGSRLVTQHGDNDSASSAYDLKNGNAQTPMSPTDARFAWPALYPNGQFLLTNGAPWSPFQGVGLQGGGWNADAQLFSVPAGNPIASTGIPAGLRAGSPAFSPDGKHVAFNLVAGPGADGKSLAIMDYAASARTFSNLRVLYTPPAGMTVWPTFLPTNDAVVFELETLGNGRDWGGTRSTCDSSGSCSDTGTRAGLWWIDVNTKTVASLSNLNGGAYLPTLAATGHTSDVNLNYEPTVSPVPSGGYAWGIFTSRRLYGNVATINPYWSDPRFHDITATPTTKKLWAATIDLSAKPGSDPSHPAFYLPGQELLAGNSRGFWVFDACQPNGSSCQAGDECCGGYCTVTDGRASCNAQPPPCSNEFDKCTQASDCCGASLGITCIGGVCAQPTPQ